MTVNPRLRFSNALTDGSLNQAVMPGERTIGIIAWHIAQAVPQMINKTGLSIDKYDENQPEPKDAKTIIEHYDYFSKKLVDEISSKWTDADLEKEINMFGQMWKNGMTLQILISHQIHHRAQLTVLMRQAGLKVPGIMGPSKEEWASMGMTPQR